VGTRASALSAAEADVHERLPEPILECVGRVAGRLGNTALFGLLGYLGGWMGALPVAVLVAGVSSTLGDVLVPYGRGGLAAGGAIGAVVGAVLSWRATAPTQDH
jgi:hypothetical protein